MKALRDLRELAGLTQFETASRAGVGRFRLAMAESGQLKLTRAEEAQVRVALFAVLRDRAVVIHRVLARYRANSSVSSAPTHRTPKAGAYLPGLGKHRPQA